VPSTLLALHIAASQHLLSQKKTRKAKMYNQADQSNLYASAYGGYGAYGPSDAGATSVNNPATANSGNAGHYDPNQGYGAQSNYYGQAVAAPQQRQPSVSALAPAAGSTASPSAYAYGGYGYQSQNPAPGAAPSAGYLYGNVGAAPATPGGQSTPTSATPARATSSATPGRTSASYDPYGAPKQQQQLAALPSAAPSPYPTTTAGTAATTGAAPAGGAYPLSSNRPPQQASQPEPQAAPGIAGGSGYREPQRPFARNPPNRVVNVRLVPNPERSIARNTGSPQEYLTCTNEPPLATDDFVGIDNGNANPKFFRPSMLCTPGQERLLKDSHVPFGTILAPLSQQLHNKEMVSVVKRSAAPARCHRCRGYLSCHARWLEMGRKWECPLCEVVNDVPDEEFSNVDGLGRPVNQPDHPELSCGSVEFDVDEFPEYALRSEDGTALPTRPLHHLFLVDISRDAAQRFLPDYVAAMRNGLQRMAEVTPECKVSFITFASQLHFYDLRHPDMPQLCVPDVENPFVPLPFTSLCWLEVGADLDRIEKFLDRLTTAAAYADEVECVLGAAVKAATLVLAGQHGGRVIMCAHRYPQRGIGNITPREQHKLYGTDREKELLRPIEGFWTSTASAAAKQQISFDLFMFSSEYAELVTLSNICHVTNGRVFLFKNYDPLVDNTKVTASMQQLLTEEAGYAGILRVRCSTGLRVQRYRGHFFSQTVQDMDLASVTSSSTFFVEFAHESKLEKGNYTHFQAALLYTTRSGHRRVRVHSCRLRVASSLTVLFRNLDMEATLFGFIQDTIAEAVNKGPRQARQSMTDRLIKSFSGYRMYCAADSGSGDYGDAKPAARDKKNTLLMPPRLKLLPVFLLCLMKSDALTEGTVVPIDSRVASIFDLVSMPMHKLLIYLYPSLFSLEDLATDPRIGTLVEETGHCVLPHHRQLVYDSVARDGVYVLCDEQAHLVYMWIGSRVPPKLSQLLFNMEDASTVCTANGPGEECFGERLRNVLYALMLREDGMRRLIVVHEGERAEDAFFKELKEEMGTSPMGYDEYLTHIHRTILSSSTGDF
jgi:protein transport protein SEC24